LFAYSFFVILGSTQGVRGIFLSASTKAGEKKVAGPLTYEQRWGGTRNEGIQVLMKEHSLFELEQTKGRKGDEEFFFYDVEFFAYD
jgi:hypothetical protein